MRVVSAAVLLASVTPIACAAPGTTMPTEGTLRDALHTTSGGAAAVWTGDFPGSRSEGSVVGGARVSHQIARNVAIGGDVAFGGPFIGGSRPAGSGPDPTSTLFATCAHVRVSPDSDHVAFTGGVGGGALFGGTNWSMGFFALDAGVRVGTHYRRMIEAYLGENVIWSYAIIDSGLGTPSNPPYVFYFATDAGIIGHPTPRFAVGANLSMYLGVSSSGQFVGQNAGGSGGGSRPVFIPGLFVRYTFGGSVSGD